MRARILTLRFSPTLGGFDDTTLQDLLRDKELLELREHFFSFQDVAHLLCVVLYQQAVASPAAPTGNGAVPAHGREKWQDRPDPALGLPEAERVLFATLREWRAETARKEGAPPYVVLTNRQLLAIVRAKPASANALSQINGVGPAKVER